jgi:hypothetical protein
MGGSRDTTTDIVVVVLSEEPPILLVRPHTRQQHPPTSSLCDSRAHFTCFTSTNWYKLGTGAAPAYYIYTQMYTHTHTHTHTHTNSTEHHSSEAPTSLDIFVRNLTVTYFRTKRSVSETPHQKKKPTTHLNRKYTPQKHVHLT